MTTDKAEIYLEGLRIAANIGSISCMILQRKLSISYAFAFRIIEWMIEQESIVKGLKKDYIKKVLIAPKECERFRENINLQVPK